MIEHIVLFRWTPETSTEGVDRAMTGLRGLKGKIAGIVDLSCGADFSRRANGFTHGLLSG